MKFGLCVANVGSYASVRKLMALARDAEEAGWDGMFLWDTLIGFKDWQNPPICDPWVALGAIAGTTERIRLGTTITPVARRRPWKLARETVTVDRVSGGRLTLGVGLGNPPTDFSSLGEEADNRVRAGMLDEGLEVLTKLWSGEPVSHQGKYFRVKDVQFSPPPVQQPRIPIWVGGLCTSKRPWRRAARYDGVFPGKLDADDNTLPVLLEDVGSILDEVKKHRDSDEPFDVVVEGEAGSDGSQRNGPSVQEYEGAGVTWFLESVHDWLGSFEEMRERVRRGPPAI